MVTTELNWQIWSVLVNWFVRFKGQFLPYPNHWWLQLLEIINLMFKCIYSVLSSLNNLNCKEKTNNTTNCLIRHGLLSFRLVVSLTWLNEFEYLEQNWQKLKRCHKWWIKSINFLFLNGLSKNIIWIESFWIGNNFFYLNPIETINSMWDSQLPIVTLCRESFLNFTHGILLLF